MAILTEDMKRVVSEQRLGFYATVSNDGSPNLSPKGTTLVWDDDHLFFADIRSPQTVANIRGGSLVEVNVVDPFVRKGYRFKGPAVVHERGTNVYAEGLQRLREAGSRLVNRVNAIVVIEVRAARAVVSPAYDDGITTEADIIRRVPGALRPAPRGGLGLTRPLACRGGSSSIAPMRAATLAASTSRARALRARRPSRRCGEPAATP
jgi:predicted pyridoxine 5'-phosphate oxidase superfamily flavin-nucleotide-binding protein